MQNKILQDGMNSYTIPERKINQGFSFYFYGKILIPSEESIIVAVTTGNKYAFMTPPLVKTSYENVDIYAYENWTGLTNGSDLITHNSNRALQNSSTFQLIKIGVTLSNKGTEFWSDFIAGASGIGGQSTGGSNLRASRKILEKNTNYALEVYNGHNESQYIHAMFEWYENEKIWT